MDRSPLLIHRLVRLGISGALMFSAAASLGAQSRASDAEAPGLVVRGLTFKGNHAYTAEVLATVIATTNSSAFASSPLLSWMGLGEKRYIDELEFRRDVLRLTAYYREGGYLEARVDTLVRRTPENVKIEFRITEGTPVVVDTFTITGLDALPREDRERALQDLPL